MPARDGYIPAVPCWINTSPTQRAALGFYSGLFGWDFENVMPEGSDAAARVPPRRARRMAGRRPRRVLDSLHLWLADAPRRTLLELAD